MAVGDLVGTQINPVVEPGGSTMGEVVVFEVDGVPHRGPLILPTAIVAGAAQQQTAEVEGGRVKFDVKDVSAVTELQAIKGHVDLVESKLDTVIAGLVALLAELEGKPEAQPLTDTQLRASPVPISGAASAEDAQEIRDRLPEAFTSGGGVKTGIVDALPAGNAVVGGVRDRYVGGEILADQDGGGAALTFTFTSAVDLVWVRCDGGDGRADPFSGTPAEDVGIICEDGIPQPITVTTSNVKVFAQTGTSVSVWGFRY